MNVASVIMQPAFWSIFLSPWEIFSDFHQFYWFLKTEFGFADPSYYICFLFLLILYAKSSMILVYIVLITVKLNILSYILTVYASDSVIY